MTAYAPPELAAPRTAGKSAAEPGQLVRKIAALSPAGAEHAASPGANAGPHARRLAVQRAALNGSRASSEAPVQGVFQYQGITYDSAEKVTAKFTPMDVGSSKGRPAERVTVRNQRFEALLAMAVSKEDHGQIPTLLVLKDKVANFANQQKLLAAAVPSGLLKSSGKATVSVSEMQQKGSTDALPKELRMLVDLLLQSGRAFPEENILKAAKEATGAHGSGFYHELALAAELLNSGDVMIQVGVVNPEDLPGYLGFEPPESEIPAEGFVGGDVTVWNRPADPSKQAPGQSTFIQAKTANKSTVKANVLAAGNQLAGLTASGKPGGKQAQREFTLTGPRYEGAIFVNLIDNLDPSALAKIAGDVMTKHRDYVSRVVFRDMTGYFEVSEDDRKGTYFNHNPLLAGRPEVDFPEPDDDYEEEEEEELTNEEIDRRLDMAEYWADF